MPETPQTPAPEGEEIAPEDEARISKVVKKLLGQTPPAPTPAPATPPAPAPHASSGGGDVTAQVTAALQQHEERNKTATRITDLEKQVADMKNAKPKKRWFFSPLFGE